MAFTIWHEPELLIYQDTSPHRITRGWIDARRVVVDFEWDERIGGMFDAGEDLRYAEYPAAQRVVGDACCRGKLSLLSATFDHDRHFSTKRSNLAGRGGRLCI